MGELSPEQFLLRYIKQHPGKNPKGAANRQGISTQALRVLLDRLLFTNKIKPQKPGYKLSLEGSR